MIEATPRELAETLVHTRSTPEKSGYRRRTYLYVGEVEIQRGDWSFQAKMQLRVALQRLIEDERRRADEMVRLAVRREVQRAVENCQMRMMT